MGPTEARIRLVEVLARAMHRSVDLAQSPDALVDLGSGKMGAAWRRFQERADGLLAVLEADGLTGGVIAIALERGRQMLVEGWTAEHDDRHFDGKMAIAASLYANHAARSDSFRNANRASPAAWPFEEAYWKPSTRRRELEKAGALIAAELDRLNRAEVPCYEVAIMVRTTDGGSSPMRAMIGTRAECEEEASRIRADPVARFEIGCGPNPRIAEAKITAVVVRKVTGGKANG